MKFNLLLALTFALIATPQIRCTRPQRTLDWVENTIAENIRKEAASKQQREAIAFIQKIITPIAQKSPSHLKKIILSHNEDGHTALHIATINNNKNFVIFLINVAVKCEFLSDLLDAVDNDNKTAHWYAVMNKELEGIAEIFKHLNEYIVSKL